MFSVRRWSRFEHCIGGGGEGTYEQCSNVPHTISMILILILEETDSAYKYVRTERCSGHRYKEEK
jgi:hypothetical protein